MELIFRICLIIAGIINLIPSLLAFVPDKINNSYGIDVPNINYELLLRHRAVLLGIIGGLMIYAAIVKRHYNLATVVGLISMISFVILYKLMDGEINPELNKVMKIDILAIVILMVGFGLFKMK